VDPTWFLGPKGENQDLLMELIRGALEEHVAWRRAFHPEDPSPIAANLQPNGLGGDAATMKRQFRSLLDELRESVPSFHGRYNGHMLSEQTIVSQAAYFAAMLYDPNNVSPEVSPVTTRLEGEVAAQLERMVGYDPDTSWGHLTSGGTLANFEALWIARNVLYQPVAVGLAARDLGIALSANLPNGTRGNISELGLWELLNISPSASLDLSDQLWASASRSDVAETLAKYSLATLGYQDYTRSLATEFGDPLRPGVVLASAAGHYSWEKILRALGIGSNQLVLVSVDAHCRMNSQALWETVKSLTDKRTPIMACVTVCGTTEEGAIDPIDEILEVRSEAERKLGVTFHVHADACYGGYAASVTRGTDGGRLDAAAIRKAVGGEGWPSERIVESVCALEGTDSIAIDPHKLGYVPYPAGAFLLKDKRGRELVAVDPPYLALSDCTSVQEPVIGRFIFEGSKPGAAAAAVWMSHTAIPLDVSGHGRIIGATARAANRLHEELGQADFSPFRVVRLPEPDLNIVCFLIAHDQLSIEEINSLNEAIYDQLSPGSEVASDYFVTRTRLTSPAYDGAVPGLLSKLGPSAKAYWREHGTTRGISVLRATIMNPFASEQEPDHVGGLIDALRHAAHRATVSLIKESNSQHENGYRPEASIA
jgi:glutamate/tyrosine decarboxylase-like PLP-dependent enzyme